MPLGAVTILLVSVSVLVFVSVNALLGFIEIPIS